MSHVAIKTYLGRALIKFSTAVRNTDILLKGVSSPNLISIDKIAFGERFALMILGWGIKLKAARRYEDIKK